MRNLTLTTEARSKFSKLINDPRAQKIAAFAKDNWQELAVVAAVALIMEDVDTAADLAETSLTLDILTAVSEGVIS